MKTICFNQNIFCKSTILWHSENVILCRLNSRIGSPGNVGVNDNFFVQPFLIRTISHLLNNPRTIGSKYGPIFYSGVFSFSTPLISMIERSCLYLHKRLPFTYFRLFLFYNLNFIRG